MKQLFAFFLDLILPLSSLWPVFPSLANVDADTVLSEGVYKTALPALTFPLADAMQFGGAVRVEESSEVCVCRQQAVQS